jgi:starch phosphorylase
LSRAREIAVWEKRVATAWPQLKIEVRREDEAVPIHVGDSIKVSATIFPAGLTADDLRVEAFAGQLDAHGDISKPSITAMSCVGHGENGSMTYEAVAVLFDQSGRHGYTVRVTPQHPDVTERFIPGLIAWAAPSG